MNLHFSPTRKLTIAGFLVAMTIIFGRIPGFSWMIPLFGLPSFKLDISGIFIMLGGTVLGPLWGGIIGASADLLGVLAFSVDQPHPGFTLNAILTGVLPGLIAMLPALKKLSQSKWANYGLLSLLILGSLLFILLTNSYSASGQTYELTLGIKMALIILIVVSVILLVLLNRTLGHRTNRQQFYAILFQVTVVEFLVYITLTPLWIYNLQQIPIFVSFSIRFFRALLMIPMKTFLLLILNRTVPLVVPSFPD